MLHGLVASRKALPISGGGGARPRVPGNFLMGLGLTTAAVATAVLTGVRQWQRAAAVAATATQLSALAAGSGVSEFRATPALCSEALAAWRSRAPPAVQPLAAHLRSADPRGELASFAQRRG